MALNCDWLSIEYVNYLGTEAHVTGRDIPANIPWHLWPPVIMRHQLQGFPSSAVTSQPRVMRKHNDPMMEIGGVQNVDLAKSTIPGNLGIMFMHRNWWWIFTRGTLVLLISSMQSTSTPFLSSQCRDVTALKGGGWMLGDAPLHLMFPPIVPCHLCTSLLIVASPRWSALAAPIAESDSHVM